MKQLQIRRFLHHTHNCSLARIQSALDFPKLHQLPGQKAYDYSNASGNLFGWRRPKRGDTLCDVGDCLRAVEQHPLDSEVWQAINKSKSLWTTSADCYQLARVSSHGKPHEGPGVWQDQRSDNLSAGCGHATTDAAAQELGKISKPDGSAGKQSGRPKSLPDRDHRAEQDA